MTFHRRVAAAAALLVGLGGISSTIDNAGQTRSSGLFPAAHAQNFIKNLIARLRGETLPDGIVKTTDASRPHRSMSRPNIPAASSTSALKKAANQAGRSSARCRRPNTKRSSARRSPTWRRPNKR